VSGTEKDGGKSDVQPAEDLRRSLAARAVVVAEQLNQLGAQAALLFDERLFDPILASLDAANTFHEERPHIDAPALLSEAEARELETLSNPPGYSRPRWHPKRWWAGALRFLFGRQYEFNARVNAYLQRLIPHIITNRQVTTALLAAANAQLHHLVDHERRAAQALAEMLAQLSEFVETVLPQCALVPGPPQTSPERHADIADTLQALAEAQKLLAAYGERLGRLEQLAQQIEVLREKFSVAASRANTFESQVTQTLDQLSAEVRALREWASAAAPRAPQPEVGVPSPAPASPGGTEAASRRLLQGFSFLDFEQALRGSELQIAEEQAKYVEWFRGCAPVLDAGCGRGEFLDLLRRNGIESYGIDCDADMVAYCRARGLRAEQAELDACLNSLPEASLGGVFLGQVIEHLEQRLVLALPALLWSKLAPGGAVVIETVNPMCLSTFAGAMYADPTHVRPIHPRGLEFLMTNAGFVDTTIILSAPVPETEKLAPLREKAPLDPTAKDLVLQMNTNIERLNTLLYSYANYALAARKPR